MPVLKIKKDGKWIDVSGGAGVSSWNDLTDKPFDAEPPVTSTEVTLEEITFEGFENGRYLTDTFNLIEGAECTVIWDGAEYTFTCEKDTQEGFQIIIIGNPALADIENAKDNGQPFCIITLPECGFTCLFSNDSNATSHTVRIISNVTTQIVYKLDNKYINAEWTAETPVYERVFTLPKTTVSATMSFAGLYGGFISAEAPNIKTGSIVNFEFDGIKYTSIAHDGAFGNAPLITNNSLPGFPCAGMINDGSVVFFCKTEGDHVVELTVDEPTYEQLPTEYISDVLDDIQDRLKDKAFKSDTLSLYEKQTIADAQKARARTNICAVGYDTAQTLTEAEKAQARINIGADTMPEVSIEDNGKFLRVVDGVWATASTPSAEDVGARPNTWMPTAAEVGAVTEAQVTTLINNALGVIENGAY